MKRKRVKVKPIPSIIPSVIYNNENLSDGAKVFYGVVVFLARESGVAFAGTRYFAKQLGRTTRSIQYYISELYTKKIIDIELKDGVRYIYPSVIPLDASDVASFIPPEVVRQEKVSAAVKLTYGLIQYKTANKNGYYAFDGIESLTEITNKSRSTIYRHLKIYKSLSLVKFERVDRYTRIYSFNSYQDAIKYKNNELDVLKTNDPPDQIDRPKVITSSINKEVEAQLRALIGR